MISSRFGRRLQPGTSTERERDRSAPSIAPQAGINQQTLASLIALDASTTAGVVDRLELRGLLVRNASPDDKRARLLSCTRALSRRGLPCPNPFDASPSRPAAVMHPDSMR